MADKFTKNKYVCDMCSGVIVTDDVDEGTTPSMLACKADSKCKGIMHSVFYSPAAVGDAEPTHEWFRPTREIRRAGNQAYREYYAKGGLSLRRVDGQVVL